ncbi:MAG TPA: alpha-amylase family protein [Labilithrix sp.]|nr:alpha-amylase family protein [Labilithrix sp.]
MGRRSLLGGLLGFGVPRGLFGGSAITGLAGCESSDDAMFIADEPGPRWMFQARIAGLDLSDPDVDAGPSLDAAGRAGASVIEGDSVLSDYLDNETFEREARRIELYAKSCHARNLKLVWYYPALEVLSPDAEKPGVRSIYKDHPDWIQVSIDQRPNVFYGSKEHWVDPFAESAWLCHNSGYRNYFFDRIRRLAATGVDGLWIDVPLFIDTVLRWTCHNRACVDKFRADTGLSAEHLLEDWTDPVFRKWVYWRHEELSRFCMETLAVARSVKEQLEIVFEVVTMDTDIATVQALDASYRTFELSKPLPSAASLVLPDRIDRVWELDSVSNRFGMRPALADDWLCKIRGAKFARGCDRPRPSWVFSYGAEEPDAGLVMALLCATGCNPYETKTPEMTTTVGADFRTRMFQFIRRHAELLFQAEPLATVGVLHSSPSRDYVDRGPIDTAFFVSAVNELENHEVYSADNSFFWGSSLRNTTYCADYGGAVKALSHLHVPFAIVPLQTITEGDTAFLGSFRLLVAPSLQNISDLHEQMLDRFVKAGGHLLVCGQSPGHADQFGSPKPEEARLDRLLGFDAASGAVSVVEGRNVTYRPELIGRDYLSTEDAKALSVFEGAIDAAGARRISLDRKEERNVHVELTRHAGRYVLHLVNYGGVPTDLTIRPGAATAGGDGPYPFQQDYAIHRRDLAVELTVPEPIARVSFLSPDRQFVEAEAKWLGGGRLEVPVFQYTVVVLEV